jgi:hypothetical protein
VDALPILHQLEAARLAGGSLVATDGEGLAAEEVEVGIADGGPVAELLSRVAQDIESLRDLLRRGEGRVTRAGGAEGVGPGGVVRLGDAPAAIAVLEIHLSAP